MSEQERESTELAYAIVPVAMLLFATAGMVMYRRATATPKVMGGDDEPGTPQTLQFRKPRSPVLSPLKALSTAVTIDPSKRDVSYAVPKLNIVWPKQFKTDVIRYNQLVFLHIPKTGGTNVSYLMRALSLADPEKYKAIRYRAPRAIGKSSIQIDEDWRGSLDLAVVDLTSDVKKSHELNFVCGHFPFGIHEHLAPNARYVTVVRDPIERELSFVNFMWQRGLLGTEAALAQEIARDMLLTAEIDNPQTRMLAGSAYMSATRCNESTFKRAIQNLEEHFALVGITAELDAFIETLASIQGWGPIALARAQVTNDKIIPKLDTFDELREKLEKKHEWDLKLYDYARERWVNWKKAHPTTQGGLSTKSATTQILTIPASFAENDKFSLMTSAEIEEFNKRVGDGLVRLQQSTSGKPTCPLPPSPRAPKAPTP